MQADRHVRPFDPASPPDAMREYEARRCHVCQARHPAFGFGPPLTRPGMALWACSTHRAEVDHMLTGSPRPKAAAKRQPTLL